MNLTLPTKLLLLALPGAVESATFWTKSLSVDLSETDKPVSASPPSAARDEDGLLSQQCLEDNFEMLEMDPEYQAVYNSAEQTCHPSTPNIVVSEEGALATFERGLCDFSGLEEFCNAHADYQAVRLPYRLYAACSLPLLMDPSMPPVYIPVTQIVYNDIACFPRSCDLSGGLNEQMLLQLVEYTGDTENCMTHVFEGPVDDVAPSKSGKASKGAKGVEGKAKRKGRGDKRQ